MKFKRILITCAATSLFAFGQAEKKEQPQQPAGASQMPPEMKPAVEMERLSKAMVGDWTVEEEFLPREWMPKGARGRGKDVIKMGPGGFSIVTDYSGTAMPGFTGHGMVSWSPEEQVYKSYWVDSVTPGGSVHTGKWQGNRLVFAGAESMGGQTFDMRQTYSDITPNSFTFTMEFGRAGSELKPTMILRYTRVSGNVRKQGRVPQQPR